MEPVGGTLVVERSKTNEHLGIQYRRNIHRDRRGVVLERSLKKTDEDEDDT